MIILYLKRLESSKFVRVKAFPMYGGIGVSAPSLYRTDQRSEVRQRDVINYSLAHVRERNANLEARSRVRVVRQGTKRRC